MESSNGATANRINLLHLDYIGFMTDDFHGPWSDHAGHNSPLYDCPPDPDGSMEGVPLLIKVIGMMFRGTS